VLIRRKDGQVFVLKPKSRPGSVLEVEGVDLNLSASDIVGFIHEGRRKYSGRCRGSCPPRRPLRFPKPQRSGETLRRERQKEIDEGAWSALYATTSLPFDPPVTGKIAVKVINHYGDEVMKVYPTG
jgi:hypothetical protein